MDTLKPPGSATVWLLIVIRQYNLTRNKLVLISMVIYLFIYYYLFYYTGQTAQLMCAQEKKLQKLVSV